MVADPLITAKAALSDSHHHVVRIFGTPIGMSLVYRPYSHSFRRLSQISPVFVLFFSHGCPHLCDDSFLYWRHRFG